MTGKQKLELTWIGKENRPKLEPRILLEDPERSYHAPHRVTDHDLFDNRLIFGDNLLALKALEQEFTGKVKCVFIDPPYNTGSAFEHYDDGVEHSLWLSLMRDRLEIIHRLLSEDGSLWITIDDNEAHYLKIVCDEVFGRANFIANVVWQKIFAPKSSARHLSASHDHVLVFAKDADKWERNLQPRSEAHDIRYKNPDNDSRGVWASDNLTARNYYSLGLYAVKCPSGRVIEGPPKGTYWRVSKEKFDEMDRDNRIWWGSDGDNMPRLKRFLSEVQQGVVPQTIWLHNEVGNTQEAKKEALPYATSVDDIFQTPKPERLIKRVLDIATNPDDWVLDSFGGSGTTGAVAHKMGRRWIMVELGEHCHTHIIPRLKKVIDGEDTGGITEAVGWNGGGGFQYYRLAPSLLEKDKWGNWVINKAYNPTMLAEAVCKLEGFTYAPSDTIYWQHGRSTERDFIYVTTQNLSHDQLQALSDEVGESRSLLVMCTAFRGKPDRYPNLTIKKIPKTVMTRCEWGKDDYSLRVENLPKAPPPPRQMELISP
ncbi:MAG: site-specific DNA-methyltransferase [Candidatus Methylomirabilota bacterium]|nr:site-specific DNA-methyltransferase [Candidatus Methylomirabilis sp.]NJD68284.1 site-specific DNA-methyltransferase [candidate division NC10 bacterium]PWB43876.1 MAG: site-specific DNA-methyltransferase [candidate division NC10 bacterium]